MRGACSTGMWAFSVRVRPGVRALLLRQAIIKYKAFAGRVTEGGLCARSFALGGVREASQLAGAALAVLLCCVWRM